MLAKEAVGGVAGQTARKYVGAGQTARPGKVVPVVALDAGRSVFAGRAARQNGVAGRTVGGVEAVVPLKTRDAVGRVGAHRTGRHGHVASRTRNNPALVETRSTEEASLGVYQHVRHRIGHSCGRSHVVSRSSKITVVYVVDAIGHNLELSVGGLLQNPYLFVSPAYRVVKRVARVAGRVDRGVGWSGERMLGLGESASAVGEVGAIFLVVVATRRHDFYGSGGRRANGAVCKIHRPRGDLRCLGRNHRWSCRDIIHPNLSIIVDHAHIVVGAPLAIELFLARRPVPRKGTRSQSPVIDNLEIVIVAETYDHLVAAVTEI